MKFKCEFEIVDIGDESIAVPVGQNAKDIQGVLKMNREGAEIVQFLLAGKEVAHIVDALTKSYEEEASTIISYVDMVIKSLEAVGVLEV